MLNIPRIYNTNNEKIAYLDKAYNISYELKMNELWYAYFTLPADDDKNQYCEPYNFVEIFDGDDRIGLFRILPNELVETDKAEITYTCEHVLATLLDDVMFKYHQVGNKGVTTAECIRYVLDQQIDRRWQLGVCEFRRYFEYKWENENLLSALFSIAKPLDDYLWDVDTKTYPWTINLRKIKKEVVADVRYKKNLQGIVRTEDPTNLVTRLYALGYGEGDNQLTIESVNNGIPYLEKNIATYGLKSSILVDRRFESPETLKAYAEKLINELSTPYISYDITTIDLFKYDKNKYEKFIVGDYVKIVNKERGISEEMPIVGISKHNIEANSADIKIEVGNKPKDIAGSISELMERTRINEVYGQGATNQMIIPFYDNADYSNPATMRVYIPAEVIKINKCILNVNTNRFRGYSKAVKGGGVPGLTTSGGGGVSTTTEDGGGDYITTESGGGKYTTTESGGGGITTAESKIIKADTERGGTNITETWNPLRSGPSNTSEALPGYYKWITGHSHSFDLPRHEHQVRLPDHPHKITLPNHPHRVTLPAHPHRFTLKDHQHPFKLPDHPHEIEFGIYEGDRADRASVIIGNRIVGSVDYGGDIDITNYLETDQAGRIKRDHWHEIRIRPNSLTRIEANIFLQTFTNSRGGGDH